MQRSVQQLSKNRDGGIKNMSSGEVFPKQFGGILDSPVQPEVLLEFLPIKLYFLE